MQKTSLNTDLQVDTSTKQVYTK